MTRIDPTRGSVLATTVCVALITATAFPPQATAEEEEELIFRGDAPLVLEPRDAETLAAHRLQQQWGRGLLASGLTVILGGVVMIEADPYGDVGFGGFVTTGAGIGVLSISMFLLGFSRPVHDVAEAHRIVACPTRDRRGATVGWSATF